MTHKSYEAMKDENQHLRDTVKEKQDQLDKNKHDLMHSESKVKDISVSYSYKYKDQVGFMCTAVFILILLFLL